MSEVPADYQVAQTEYKASSRYYGKNHFYEQIMRHLVNSDTQDFQKLKDFQYVIRPSIFGEFDRDCDSIGNFVMVYRSPHTDQLIRVPIDAQDIAELNYLDRMGALVQ